MEELLEIKGLKIDFRTAKGVFSAVKGAGFSVRREESVVLAGESGSGKTITALSIAGLLPPEASASGSIIFNGRQMLGLSDRQMESLRGREIAYVFQEPYAYLNPVYRIGEQISEVLMCRRGMGRADSERECLRLLELVKITDGPRVCQSYPHQLSGGMNQRAFIAMALACEPKLLIADEPTTSLDATVEDRIIGLLNELRASLKFSLLFITHNLSVARRLADRLVIMHRGEVVEEGKTSAIFGSPRHAHTRELIDAYERIGRLSSPGGRP